MDLILQHNRAKLVKKYRESPNLWPDGIDHAGNRWYGDGSAWPQDMVELWASDRWLEERLRGVPVTLQGGPVTQGVTQGSDTGLTVEEKRRLQTRERVAKHRARKLFEGGNPDAGG